MEHAKSILSPRITAADVQANIVAEYYFTAADGYCGAEVLKPDFMALAEGERTIEPPVELESVTICVLVLRNGTRVVGVNYGSIDLSAHDEQRGRDEARLNAAMQIFPMMGYELRSKLAEQQG